MRNYNLWNRITCSFWEDETAQAERGTGFAGILRGMWMLNPLWQSIPAEVQGNLIPQWFTEWQWGVILVVVCSFQISVAGRRGPRPRYYAATTVAVVQGMAALGYWRAGLFFRGVVPFILTMCWIELWIAWRARYDNRTSRQLEERRSGY